LTLRYIVVVEGHRRKLGNKDPQDHVWDGFLFLYLN
jgi:hypothetical protein